MVSKLDKLHASLVVSVLNHETKRTRRDRSDELNKQTTMTTNSEANVVTTFSVDFASTPIKLAPKTSTPVRRYR